MPLAFTQVNFLVFENKFEIVISDMILIQCPLIDKFKYCIRIYLLGNYFQFIYITSCEEMQLCVFRKKLLE